MNPTNHSPSAFLKRNSGFLGYVFVLLLISGIAFLSFSLLGCGTNTEPSCNEEGTNHNDANMTTSIETTTSMASPVLVTASMKTLNFLPGFQPGEKLSLLLKGTWEEAGNGEMEWSPPFGVNTVEFPGKQPAPGGPPYVFKNVTPAEAAAGIPVAYKVPPPMADAGGAATTFEDELTVTKGSGLETASTVHYYAASSSVQAAVPPERASTGDPVPVWWNVVRYVDIAAPMNQTACQTLVTQGKSANAFMAWRLPVADQIVPNESYTLPLIASGDVQPWAKLISNTVQVNMPLEVRLAATKWANANLPSAPGEMWVALGVDPDASITCPAMNSDTYTISSNLSFDLSGRPQACANCVLPAYICYKTGSAAASALLGTVLNLLGSGAPRSVAGDTTCLGPAGTTLVDGNASDWFFDALDAFLNLKPSDPIEIHYLIFNNSSTAQAFTFSTTSNLPDVAWIIYPGKSDKPWEPDLDHPLTGTSVNVPGNNSFDFYIRGTTPAGATAGQYSYSMTVTGGAGANPASWKGGTILNVSSTGQLPDMNPPVAAVGVSGAAAPSPALSDQDLTYTLTVDNSGALQLTGLALTDTLPLNTTYVSCSGADSCALSGNIVTWNLASLDAGLTHSMTLVVHVNAGLEAGTLLSNTTYSVVATGQSVSASGAAVTTAIGDAFRLYLPLIKR